MADPDHLDEDDPLGGEHEIPIDLPGDHPTTQLVAGPPDLDDRLGGLELEERASAIGESDHALESSGATKPLAWRGSAPERPAPGAAFFGGGVACALGVSEND